MKVPVEATAFMGVAGGLLVLLVVFLVYFNKMLCFAHVETVLPCCPEKPWKEKELSVKQQLSKSYGYDHEAETSTDSDDGMLQRLQRTANGLRKPGTFSIHRHHRNRSVDTKSTTSSIGSHCELLGSKRGEPCGDLRSRGSRGSAGGDSSSDLISLAEKGRVGGGASSTSSGSSETSGGETPEDEEGGGLPAAIEAAAAKENNGTVLLHNTEFTGKTDSGGDDDAQNQADASDQIICGYRNSAMEHDELFDVSDLGSGFGDQDSQCDGPTSISKCGSLEVAFAYDSPTRKMTIHVLQAKDVPAKDRGGSNTLQIRLVLLPSRKQKHKTKIRQGSNPQFNESFLFNRVNPEEVNSMGVRFRLYGCERMRRERMIGETIVAFAAINLSIESNLWLSLEPRSNLSQGCDPRADVTSLARSDSASSTQSMQHGGLPELLLGLSYNGTTGRLSVEVVKGSHFRNLAMNRAPDTFVKLTLVSSNQQEMAHSKTSIRRGQPNPLFKETFMFQVALFQLPEVSLTVAVYNKRGMKRKEMIGWFALGYNSSGEEELSHWNDMRESKGEQVARWHVLLDS